MINILQNQEFVNFDDYFSNEIYGRIYRITNLINGKIYIGQTTKSIKERFKGHIKCAKDNKYNNYFHNHLRKYGIENFIIEEIDIAYSLDELNQKECEWILKENCLKPYGYNIKPGGNQKGFLEETKQKISKSKKGKKIKSYPKSDSHKQKLREVNLGKKLSEETKQKISKSGKGKKRSIEFIENHKRMFKGFKHSEETKLLLSNLKRGKKCHFSEKHKYNLSKSNWRRYRKWYYNRKENIKLFLLKDDIIPDGFELMNLDEVDIKELNEEMEKLFEEFFNER